MLFYVFQNDISGDCSFYFLIVVYISNIERKILQELKILQYEFLQSCLVKLSS